jgi:hypothetical protein
MTKSRMPLLGYITILIASGLIAVGTARAEDLQFGKCGLVTMTDRDEVSVSLTVGDAGIAVHRKHGTASQFELPYAAITRISYAFTARRRLAESAALGPLIAILSRPKVMIEGQDHWLVIEHTAAGVPQPILLRLDTIEIMGVVATLNARRGERVQLLDFDNTVVNPTFGSHDEDVSVPFSAERTMSALKTAMHSLGCNVGKSTADTLECHRGPHPRMRAGFGGETVIASLEIQGAGTRVRIKTIRGLGRNWSSAVLREMQRLLAVPVV